jgi:hypothetical protein
MTFSSLNFKSHFNFNCFRIRTHERFTRTIRMQNLQRITIEAAKTAWRGWHRPGAASGVAAAAKATATALAPSLQ